MSVWLNRSSSHGADAPSLVRLDSDSPRCTVASVPSDSNQPETNARQRQWALCAGVPIDETTSYRKYRARIESVKPGLRDVSNTKSQRALAARLGTELPANGNGWDAASYLSDLLDARAWVYSVCRKLSGQRWKHYRQSGLNDGEVCRLAREIFVDAEIKKYLSDREGGANSSGDAWFRIMKAA